MTTPMGRPARIAAWTLALIALGLVFAAYLKPEMMLALATQLWACF